MDIPQDLRSIRKARGLTLDALASGMLRRATLSDIENGKRWPSKSTRRKLESILGPQINWVATYAGDRTHIVFALKEFVNSERPGASERIKFARRALILIDEKINTKK